MARAFAPWRFSTIVVSVFSTMALTFAAVGLAALVAYAVPSGHARSASASRSARSGTTSSACC